MNQKNIVPVNATQEAPINLTPQPTILPTNARDEIQRKLKTDREKDREIVKGIFKNHETPGGSMEFCFKKYKEDPLEQYKLQDNKIYSIPLGVAKHINNGTSYVVHEHSRDEDGNPSNRVGQKVRRFSFQSLEYMDVNEMDIDINRISTVNHVILR